MLELKLTCKSAKESKPSIQTSQLIKAGMLAMKPNDGDEVILQLVNSSGIVAEQDFYASRDGSTLYARKGFNNYLFPVPSVNNPVTVGCCGVAGLSYNRTAKITSKPAYKDQQESVYDKSLFELNSLITSLGTKVAAARHLGISVDTFRRALNKARAAQGPVNQKLPGIAEVPRKQKSTNVVVKKKTKKVARTFGEHEWTIRDIKQALRESNGVKAEAAYALQVSARTLGRWLAEIN